MSSATTRAAAGRRTAGVTAAPTAPRLRCLETDAGGPTCYDGALSAEIDAFDHLGRGRAKSKVRCDLLHESISP